MSEVERKPLPSGLYLDGSGAVRVLQMTGKVLDRSTFPQLYQDPASYGLEMRNGSFRIIPREKQAA